MMVLHLCFIPGSLHPPWGEICLVFPHPNITSGLRPGGPDGFEDITLVGAPYPEFCRMRRPSASCRIHLRLFIFIGDSPKISLSA